MIPALQEHSQLEQENCEHTPPLSCAAQVANLCQTNASRTDSLIEQHPGKSLDELVAAKVINGDQKAQILKKPALLEQLKQQQAQLDIYRKIDNDYKTRLATETSTLEKTLTEKFEADKSEAIREAKDAAEAAAKAAVHNALLTLSQFLALASHRRTEQPDSTEPENLALEGVLLGVYSGDDTGVASMIKLVEGSSEQTKSITGEDLPTTCRCSTGASLGGAWLGVGLLT